VLEDINGVLGGVKGVHNRVVTALLRVKMRQAVGAVAEEAEASDRVEEQPGDKKDVPPWVDPRLRNMIWWTPAN
jgi:hypothetical protein